MIKERYMSSCRYFIICGSKQDATNQKEIALALFYQHLSFYWQSQSYPIASLVGIRSLTYWKIKLKDIKSLYRVSEDESKIITDCLLVLQKSFASPSGEHGS